MTTAAANSSDKPLPSLAAIGAALPRNNMIHLTVENVASLPIPMSGVTVYRDVLEQGLGLYITSAGSKTYFLRKRVKGKDERIIIGSCNDMAPEQARHHAQQLKLSIHNGIDVKSNDTMQEDKSLTLGEHFNRYMERYSKVHKKSWRYDEREINRFLKHWFGRRLCDITRQEIRQLHEGIYQRNGLYQANRILERLRAMYNKAIEWDWEGKNPTIGIKKYRETSRDRFIQLHEMPHFINALAQEECETARDYLWILLLTGARKTNAMQMRWEEIDWQSKFWRIPDSKNGSPVVIPLLEQVVEILRRRQATQAGPWVFASEQHADKHVVNFKRVWRRTLQNATLKLWSTSPSALPIISEARKVIANARYTDAIFKEVERRAELAGVHLQKGLMDVRIHDIRRTLASYQAINGTSLQIIGQSLGHKSLQSVQVYSRLTLEPVRASLDKASATMLQTIVPSVLKA